MNETELINKIKILLSQVKDMREEPRVSLLRLYDTFYFKVRALIDEFDNESTMQKDD